MLTEEAIEVVKHFDLLVDYEDAIRFIMDYADENDYIISCAYDAIGRDEMKRFFCSDFIAIISSLINNADEKAQKHLEPEFKDFLANFYTEALAGTLVDWAREKHNKDKVLLSKCLFFLIYALLFLSVKYNSFPNKDASLHSSAARGLFHRAANFYNLFLLQFINSCCNRHVSNPLCRCIYCCRSRNCIEYNNNSNQNYRQAPLASKIPCNQFHIQKTT